MRIVQGSIKDAYHIHKMWLEFKADTGRPISPEEKTDLSEWLDFFGNPKAFCRILMHGKKHVGMSLGTLPTGDGKIHMLSTFIKRGFRGKRDAIRTLRDDLLTVAKASDAIALLAVVPENQVEALARKGFKVSAYVVEKSINWGKHGK